MGLWSALKEGWMSYNKYISYEMMAYLPEWVWDEMSPEEEELTGKEREDGNEEKS